VNDNKRWVADVLVLWFVVACSARSSLNRQTGVGVSGIGVEDAVAAASVGICVAVAGGADSAGVVSGSAVGVGVGVAAVGVAIGGVNIEGVGGVDKADGVVGNVFVAVANGVGVEGVGRVDDAGGSVGIAVCGDADSAGIANLACVAVAVAVEGVSVEDAVTVKSVRALADAATLSNVVEGTCDVDDASGVVRVTLALPASDGVSVVIAEMRGDVGSEVGTAGGGSADAGSIVMAAVDTEGVGCVGIAISVVGVALAVAVGGCIGIEGAGIDDGVASVVVAAGVAVGGVGVVDIGVAAGCIGAVVAEMQVLRGAGDVGGIGLSVAGVKGVCHRLPPFLPNLFLPLLYLTPGRSFHAYLIYRWTVLTFSRDFHMLP